VLEAALQGALGAGRSRAGGATTSHRVEEKPEMQLVISQRTQRLALRRANGTGIHP
jgi:hypothetical protein